MNRDELIDMDVLDPMAALTMDGLPEGGGEGQLDWMRRPGLSLSWQGLYWGHEGMWILYSLAGHIDPGELVCLMGASGAGKSSLLNALAGRTTPSPGLSLTGQIRFDEGVRMGEYLTLLNGERVPWRPLVGYVEQHDAFYAFLSVKETLALTAAYHGGRSGADARATQVMQLLGVSHRQHALMGLAQEGPASRAASGRLSGGERKRVAIADALLLDPALLFLDEPTTGLDAFTAHYTLSLLRRLAKEHGKTVLCTIHQPRYQSLLLFDRIMLLSEGFTIFDGHMNGKTTEEILV